MPWHIVAHALCLSMIVAEDGWLGAVWQRWVAVQGPVGHIRALIIGMTMSEMLVAGGQARNRRLASDVQALQQLLRAKDDAMAQMQDRLAGLDQEVRHKADLVQSLEADLLHASQSAGRPVGPAPSEDGAPQEPQSSGGASASLLSIVTSQRDRFRGRYAVAPHSSEEAHSRPAVCRRRCDCRITHAASCCGLISDHL